MSFRVEFKVPGLAKEVARLRNLKAALRRRVIRSAVRKSVSVVNKLAKAGVKVRYGLLRRALGVRVKVYPSGVVIGVVNARPGHRQQIGKRTHDPRFYAHLVERGAKPHGYKTRRGTHRGAKAQPFLAPAIAAGTPRIQQIFTDEINAALSKS